MPGVIVRAARDGEDAALFPMTRAEKRPPQDLESQRAHWGEKLAGRPPALELPTTRSRPPQPTTQRTRLAFKLPPELVCGLRELAGEAPLFEGVLAGFAALLYRTTRQSDLLIGLCEGERYAALRLAPEAQRGFRALFGGVRRELAEARLHALPLPQLLKAAHSTRADNLFQVLVTTDKLAAKDAQGYDLVFALAKSATSGALIYDAELFDPRVAERMLGHLTTLLADALAHPDAPLGKLAFLTEPERRTVLTEWNATALDFPRERCMHELFEERVRRCPDAPAVVFDGRSLTYAALNARANRLAQRLVTLGVGPNVLVGIAVERSPELVIGLLAIAKAGGAYVPMDPAYPRERLAFMLEDSAVGVLLTQRHLRARLPEPQTAVQLVLLDETQGASEATPPASGVRAEDLAYVIYTSGSTGKPKGVVLDHRGRVNNFTDFNRRFAVGTGDALIALASLSFDMCAYDVFGTLAAGATIVMPRPDELLDARAWAHLIQRHRVTIWHTAPAMLKMLVDLCEVDPTLAPSTLRLILLGGDWIPVTLPDRLRALAPEARVISLGGATECSMDSTLFEVEETDPAWRSIPYGAPMTNQRAYVLDEDLQPVPALVPGELYLGGIGVGSGYLGRPELTAERFLADPFAVESGARMYRTGDLARWMEDGNLELLGRVDNQVKIRGFRIELGEIEARLRTHPGVREGVVVARPDASGEKRLVAYFVAREQSELSEPRFAHLLAADLRKTLAADLPPYMVPAAYVRLAALPLSPNGKVDRKRLPEPERGRPEHLPPLVAPRDAVEEVVAGIWAEVLGLDVVGVDDPFLDLGGHSILAARVQARLAEVLPFDVALRDLFDNGTVAKLARHLRALAREGGVELDETCRTLRALAQLSDDEVRARLASNS
jgi:amino acid adenylation domain-containing protein